MTTSIHIRQLVRRLESSKRGLALLIVSSVLFLSFGQTTSAQEDWPFWRGPNFNGTSTATDLPDKWKPKGGTDSNLVWKNTDVGGRSTPVAFAGKLYLLSRHARETSEEREKLVCLDAKTGETLWENTFNVWLSDVPDTRVGWSSPTVDPETGNVYALGVCGLFMCVDGETGKTIWSIPMHEYFGLLSTYGGRTNFPVIADDLVIISGVIIGWGENSKPAHQFIGFNKNNGEIHWIQGTHPQPHDTNYSSPTLTTIDNQKALVVGSGDGNIWALQTGTGKPIWHYKFSRRALNVSPLVVGDTVYSGHSEENLTGTAMGAVASIKLSGKGDIT
ncbi:MAG: PQQ-like beta-propeller repeat protein, partial [Pirellulaceae bacterium]|nr:PQQ-like beta-propeller repeat protein [Pirellulaceae bacterium]